MKTTLATAILLLAGMPAAAHRLDEYLQATLISVEINRVQVQIRLTPGVAVLPIVLRDVDPDADGIISESEWRTYAERVLRDVSLRVDGERLHPRLVSVKFPGIEEMKEGLGEIQLEFDADVARGGTNRRLVFENHHRSSIAAYLVNCLVPRDPDIRIAGQNRNYQQSLYQLDYEQAGGRPTQVFRAWLFGSNGWLTMVTLLLSARFAFVWRQRRRL
jgi:hypothetical protein